MVCRRTVSHAVSRYPVLSAGVGAEQCSYLPGCSSQVFRFAG